MKIQITEKKLLIISLLMFFVISFFITPYLFQIHNKFFGQNIRVNIEELNEQIEFEPNKEKRIELKKQKFILQENRQEQTRSNKLEMYLSGILMFFIYSLLALIFISFKSSFISLGYGFYIVGIIGNLKYMDNYEKSIFLLITLIVGIYAYKETRRKLEI